MKQSAAITDANLRAYYKCHAAASIYAGNDPIGHGTDVSAGDGQRRIRAGPMILYRVGGVGEWTLDDDRISPRG